MNTVKRVPLTPGQRRKTDDLHAAFCARVWADASPEMREDLRKADWFIVPAKGA
jgi:hypothetical protein